MSARISVGRLSNVGGCPWVEKRCCTKRLKARVIVPQNETVKGFEDSINQWALMIVETKIEQAARCNCIQSRFCLGSAVIVYLDLRYFGSTKEVKEIICRTKGSKFRCARAKKGHPPSTSSEC
jgi:hypothetical protein